MAKLHDYGFSILIWLIWLNSLFRLQEAEIGLYICSVSNKCCLIFMSAAIICTQYDKFSRSGYFTIRRIEKFRSSTWSDMIIEQMLIRPMKVSGGLTHRREITESTLCKWILSTIVLIEVTDAMKQFCNITYATSDQHVDANNSRITRDLQDSKKLTEFFKS